MRTEDAEFVSSLQPLYKVLYMLMIGWEDLNRIQGFLELPDKVMNQVIEELKERGIITRNTIH